MGVSGYPKHLWGCSHGVLGMSVRFERNEDYSHAGRLLLDFGELNLLNPDRATNVKSCIEEIPDDIVILLIGAGVADSKPTTRGLSAGLDLSQAQHYSAHEGWDLLESFYEMIQSIRDRDIVSICSCGEFALGAAFELALACDYRFAIRDARLGLPEVNVGLPTVIMGGLLTEYVGKQTAKELIYEGITISGSDAESLGLVNAAVQPSDYPRVLAETVSVLGEKSPLVLRWQKHVFRLWRSVGLEAGMHQSIGVASRCFGTPDQKEAMRAFLEDREPEFKE